MDYDFVRSMGFGQSGEYAMLTFTDSGLGMESGIVKHIFEPFYSTKEPGKGTGLGLSIVYGIIKKQHGYITCESAIGDGTTFRIYLPLLTVSPDAAQRKFPVSELDKKGSDVILVADDNKNVRQLSKRILEEFGYTVIVARDGQEAVELFNDNLNRIDLLFLDVAMPRLNGLQVSRAVHAVNPKMKILFCSGYRENEVLNQGWLERGANFLMKPYTPKELLMKIREVLSSGN
jgi:CheY-like chemotaxis protein